MDPNQILCKIESEKTIENVTYREAVGSLMFFAMVSGLDIAYAVKNLSEYRENHDASHWNAVERIIKYVEGSMDLGIVYKSMDVNSFWQVSRI